MEEPSQPRRSNPRAWLLLALVLGILIIGDLNRRMADARRLERDSRQLATEVNSLEAQNQALQTQVAGATSDAMIEEWARSQARMIQPGERLIVPVPSDPLAPTQTPIPDEDRPRPSNLDIWWALLFGG
ncbi:MAG: septum formation initiator family protein [Anaerolineales bacterium]